MTHLGKVNRPTFVPNESIIMAFFRGNLWLFKSHIQEPPMPIPNFCLPFFNLQLFFNFFILFYFNLDISSTFWRDLETFWTFFLIS